MNEELYGQGQQLRRRILGDAYVDAAQNKTTEFDRPFQELIAELDRFRVAEAVFAEQQTSR